MMHSIKKYMFSPRTRWHVARILPFGVIYLVTTWVFIMIEFTVYAASESSDYFVISLNFPMVVFVTTTTFLVGVLVGAVEMIWLRNLFKKRPLYQKIVYKLAVYVIGGLLIIALFLPASISIEFHVPPWDTVVISHVLAFITSLSFYNSLVQMTFTILVCVIYAAISENLGYSVLMNFFTGKYHQPKVEQRIFMFLDMKDSTRLAEKLGHVQYFKFLSDYYDTFSGAIIDHLGEVYQYIGDEIVISWPVKAGISNANCVRCFFAMKRAMEKKKDYFLSHFELYPRFKAGLHAGKVTTGEIGDLKKETSFSGDVLNVTSRIQGLCNQFQSDLLISGDLLEQLTIPGELCITDLGENYLKGRDEPVRLSSIKRTEDSLET